MIIGTVSDAEVIWHWVYQYVKSIPRSGPNLVYADTLLPVEVYNIWILGVKESICNPYPGISLR
jgi:hypothetical protein